MAKAGDGARRSDQRQRQALIQIRVTDEEHLLFIRAAQKCGAPGLATWARNLLHKGCGGPSASDRVLSGALGQLAGRMQDIAHLAPKVPPEKIVQAILRVSQELHDVQRKVIGDDREGVP
ncbi:hypothetical protein [Pseudotabrizicola alkalilacus]|uniref:Plasmid mobilization relaxosome protein MobC n=1 Tax=Pseudotabrizicola alkalilacus TaxID=2305252 RepID=A0A411YWB1_9RHOB|nr:hypothetical protein [Pseudotabrizicola alkalilacus]RGP35184.1 hypothetical protein D1012_21300 [Pseudotabrizicola alkalilacus]